MTDKFAGDYNELFIKFNRDLAQDHVDQWNQKRMTGFTLHWHFEDMTGNRVEIVPEQKFAREKRNIQFITLVNILYHSVTVQHETVEEMWTNVKNVKDDRLEGLDKDKYVPAEFCDFYTGIQKDQFFVNDDIMETYLNSLENKQKMTGILTSHPIYESQISDFFLLSASEMFIFLAKCPSEERFNKHKKYTNFFIKFH